MKKMCLVLLAAAAASCGSNWITPQAPDTGGDQTPGPTVTDSTPTPDSVADPGPVITVVTVTGGDNSNPSPSGFDAGNGDTDSGCPIEDTDAGTDPVTDAGNDPPPTEDAGSPPPPTKTCICHIPRGNPGNAHVICIGTPAVPAHLSHGDYVGACGGN